MRPTLTKEQIARLLGPPKALEDKPKGASRPPMSDAEKSEIRKAYKRNPTYTMRELSKRFGRSVGAIWKAIHSDGLVR
jgi:hypothetical protein